MADQKIQKTEDGSSTVYSSLFDSTYHSHHGALSESNHVFINAGLDYMKGKEISILELGFGTGLNAILTYRHSHEEGLKINYTGLEAYPIDKKLIEELNFELSTSEKEILRDMHQLAWEAEHRLDDNFSFRKHLVRFEEYNPTASYDLIYHDAFGPGSHPEVWEFPFLSKLHSWMSDDGVLVTFCAKGSFKRALKKAGFSIESLPGPKGKREMTRAIKAN